LAARIIAVSALSLGKLNRCESPRIPVLCYHRVLPDYIDDKRSIFAVNTDQFESQMAFLEQHEFQSLSLEEFRMIMRGLHPFPKLAVVVTLDDGYADNYHIAWPIAMRRGVKLNLFISTSTIGKTGPLLMCKETPAMRAHILEFPELWRALTWQELQSMQQSGVGVGLHGHTHAKLTTMEDPTIAKELDLAGRIFREHLGTDAWAFALPYGRPGTYTNSALKELSRWGIEMVFTTISGRARLKGKQPTPLLVPRLVVHASDDLQLFAMKLSGAYDWIEPMRLAEQAFREIAPRFYVRSGCPS
jgi:peptidoglycan/xylan/chitin deacetylase (PgdA/CDA1 family)